MNQDAPEERTPDIDLGRLAYHIRARRQARDWTQVDVSERGNLSIDRIQAFEAGRAKSFRPSTILRLERGLEWAPSSVNFVLAGQPPTPFEELSQERIIMMAAIILADPARPGLYWRLADQETMTASPPSGRRLLDAMDARRQELGLTWKQVGWRADLDPGVLFDLLPRPTPDQVKWLCQAFDAALEWEDGSVDTILKGGSPIARPGRSILPSRLDRVELMPPPQPEDGTQLAFPRQTPGLGRGIGALVPSRSPTPELDIVEHAGLPEEVQKRLVDHLRDLRTEMERATEATMLKEAVALVSMLKRMTGPTKGDAE